MEQEVMGERPSPHRLLQPDGRITDCCSACGRSSPQARYKPDSTDGITAWLAGFIASCIVMGFGASWWHGIAVLLVGTWGAASVVVWCGNKKLEAAKRDG